MKKIILFSGLIAFVLLINTPLNAQCVPDGSCTDINEPGEICPENLPDGEPGIPYNQSFTILPPGSATINNNPIVISFIVIDSVINLPPGITYTTYNTKFYPDTAYCIDIGGTPTAPGEYDIKIYITPYIPYDMTDLPGPQVVDDTSLVMTVLGETLISPQQNKLFQILSATPNPFSEKTQIGYYVPIDGIVDLKVFNIFGEEIYKESMHGKRGENQFNFSGQGLGQGAYFYGISYSSDWYTGKFVKTE